MTSCRSSGRDVVGGADLPSIRVITTRRSLAPSSLTRRPLGVSCETLSAAVVYEVGGLWAYFVHLHTQSEV